MIGSNVWRCNEQGVKQKLIAWVAFDPATGNLYWTHQNGYSDRGPNAKPGNQTPAELKHYKAILKHYAARNDVLIEDRY